MSQSKSKRIRQAPLVPLASINENQWHLFVIWFVTNIWLKFGKVISSFRKTKYSWIRTSKISRAQTLALQLAIPCSGFYKIAFFAFYTQFFAEGFLSREMVAFGNSRTLANFDPDRFRFSRCFCAPYFIRSNSTVRSFMKIRAKRLKLSPNACYLLLNKLASLVFVNVC